MSCKDQWEEYLASLESATKVAGGQADGARRCVRSGCNKLVRLDTGLCLAGHRQTSPLPQYDEPQPKLPVELQAILCVAGELAASNPTLTALTTLQREAQSCAWSTEAGGGSWAEAQQREGLYLMQRLMTAVEAAGGTDEDPRVRAARRLIAAQHSATGVLASLEGQPRRAKELRRLIPQAGPMDVPALVEALLEVRNNAALMTELADVQPEATARYLAEKARATFAQWPIDAAALRRLVPLLPQQAREEVWESADGVAAQMFQVIAAEMVSTETCPDECIEKHIGKYWSPFGAADARQGRMGALALFAPYLRPSDMDAALALAERVQIEATQDSSGGKDERIERTWGLAKAATEFLAGVVDTMPPELMYRTFGVLGGCGNDPLGDAQRVIARLAARTDATDELLFAVQQAGHLPERARVLLLRGLAPHLTEDRQWRLALRVAGALSWSGAQEEALAGIFPRLPGSLWGMALEQARGITGPVERTVTFEAAAPYCPVEQWGALLEGARSNEPDGSHRLAVDILAHAPVEVMSTVLDNISQTGRNYQAEELTAVVERVPAGPLAERALGQVLEAGGYEGHVRQVLTALGPKLSPAAVTQAIQHTNEVHQAYIDSGDFMYHRDSGTPGDVLPRTIDALAPFVPTEAMGEFWSYVGFDAETVATVIPRMPRELLPQVEERVAVLLNEQRPSRPGVAVQRRLRAALAARRRELGR